MVLIRVSAHGCLQSTGQKLGAGNTQDSTQKPGPRGAIHVLEVVPTDLLYALYFFSDLLNLPLHTIHGFGDLV